MPQHSGCGMEVVLFRLHRHLVFATLKYLSPFLRKAIAYFLLLAAVLATAAWYQAHMQYVGVNDSPLGLEISKLKNENAFRLSGVTKFAPHPAGSQTDCVNIELNRNNDFFFLFSQSKGLLTMAAEDLTFDKTSTTVVYVRSLGTMSLSLVDFGLDRTFVLPYSAASCIGLFDTVMANALVSSFNGTGHFYSSISNKTHDLNYASEFIASIDGVLPAFVFKLGILITNAFLFFITTTLVNFTLRETQQRMVHFTAVVQRNLRHRQSLIPAVLKHVMESLVFVPVMVGMTFFLFEVYVDHRVAFAILLLVWFGEVFSLLSLRTETSLLFFPKFFGTYFSFFHIYFFSYPYGFSYLALLSTALWTLYTCWVFWVWYELPAIQNGVINESTPREIIRY